MTWTGQTFSVGQTLTAAQMTNLQADITAVANGDSGAPKVTDSAFNTNSINGNKLVTGSITATQLAADSVGQSEIGTGAVHWDELDKSTQQTSYNLSHDQYYNFLFTGSTRTLGWGLACANGDRSGTDVNPYGTGTEYAYAAGISVYNSTGSAAPYTLQAAYINSSAPYDLGDGIFDVFVFALVDNTTREVVGVDIAGAAPWHYNGPTNIAAKYYDSQGRGFRRVKRREHEWLTKDVNLRDMILNPLTRTAAIDMLVDDTDIEVEITQAIKNKDINLIPHPFINNDRTGKTVVMLDCRSNVGRIISGLMDTGENLTNLFTSDYIRFQNTPLTRTTPPGVIAVNARWRDTGA